MSFHIFLSTFKFNLGHLSLIAYYYKRFRGSQDMCTLVPFTHTWPQVWKVWQDPHYCLIFSNYETWKESHHQCQSLKEGSPFFSSIPTFPCMPSLHSSSVQSISLGNQCMHSVFSCLEKFTVRNEYVFRPLYHGVMVRLSVGSYWMQKGR